MNAGCLPQRLGPLLLIMMALSCAQRPRIEGARCECPQGFICVDGLCQSDRCPCPSGFTCTASRTCAANDAGTGGTTGACQSASPPARHFPLFPSQYRNALSAVTGLDAAAIELPNGPDRGLGAFMTVNEGWQAGDLQVDLYRRNAERGAARALAEAAACPGLESNGVDCALAFAARAFRRPLTEAERVELEGLVHAATPRFGAHEAVRLAVYAVLQSPKFLYRSELGKLPGVAGDTQLTSHEIASALAFFLTDSPPDAELLQAAHDDTLRSAEVRAAHAERLLSAPAAHRKVENFFMQLLGMEEIRAHPLSEQAGFQELLTSMHEETSLFLERHIWSPKAQLATLFSTNETFVDARLATHYGFSSIPSEPGFHLAQIPARQGLLTNGRFLVAHPNPPGRFPMARGLVIQGRLKCEQLPPPPVSIDARLDATAQGTARQRLDQFLGQGTCASCHRNIGELSLGLEQFDELGRHRTVDQGQVLDTRVEDQTYGTFDHTMALAVALAEAEAGQLCFVRQFLNFALDADIEGGPQGDCLVKRIHSRWKMRGLHIPALMVELVKDDVFITRSFGL